MQFSSFSDILLQNTYIIFQNSVGIFDMVGDFFDFFLKNQKNQIYLI